MTDSGYFPRLLVKKHLLETDIHIMSTDLKFKIQGSAYAKRSKV